MDQILISGPIHFDLFSMISACGFIILVLLSTVVFTQKSKNRIPNVFLALQLFCFAMTQFNSGFVFNTGLIQFFPHLNGFGGVWIILIGPLFYLYLSSLLEREFKLSARQLLHLLPCVVLIITELPVILLSGPEKIAEVARWTSGQTSQREAHYGYLVMAFILIVNITYLFFTFRLYKSREKSQGTKNCSKFVYLWLSHMFKVGIAMYLMLVLALTGLVFLGLTLNTAFRLAPILITASGLYLAIRCLTYPEIICEKTDLAIPDDPSKEKYKSLTLTETKAMEYYRRLLCLFLDNKIYIQPNLSVEHISKLLNIPRPYISFLIKKFTGLNFHDFVNSYRLEDAKKIITEKGLESKTVRYLASTSGFSSKSSFYNYFKKATGQTPHEFAKKTQIQKAGNIST